MALLVNAEGEEEERAKVVASFKDILGEQRERERCTEQALKAARRTVATL